MPTFNREKMIKKSVLSVLGQTHKDLELIIKEGGEGKGYEAIKDIKDKRLIYIYSHDTGISHAFNIGLKLASGDVFMWCNDDDILLPETLEIVSNRIGDKMWGYGRIEMYKDGVKKGEMGSPATLNDLRRFNPIPQPAVFWRREAFEKVGYMDETMKYAQDFDYWVRLMKEYPDYVFIDKVLAHYTLHDDQILSKAKSEQTRYALQVQKSI